MGPVAKRERGCEEPTGRPFYDIPEYGELDRCPVTVLTNESREAMRFYSHWSDGRFPVAGGMLDQSNTLIEAMETLTRTVRLCEAEARAKKNG
jgi:hypothetical protein